MLEQCRTNDEENGVEHGRRGQQHRLRLLELLQDRDLTRLELCSEETKPTDA